MAKSDDSTAARDAARTLEEAVSALIRHYPDSVDARRLEAGCRRVHEDLDLLCGVEQPAPAATPAPPREIIPDTPYAHDFWMDAEDEGLGRADYRTR